jgi:hypothetical protein
VLDYAWRFSSWREARPLTIPLRHGAQGNWTAALKLMDVDGLRAPPLTTPASFHINYLRPIPSDEEVFIVSTCETPVECSEVVPNSQRVQVEVRRGVTSPSYSLHAKALPTSPIYPNIWQVFESPQPPSPCQAALLCSTQAEPEPEPLQPPPLSPL